MSVGYTWVQWSRHKRIYDSVMTGGAAAFVLVFVTVSKLVWAGSDAASDEIVVMRALGACAIVLLTCILCIGPLARLDKRFLPLLYNRRHLGVLTFLVALAHAVIVLGFYHGFGTVNPLVSLLSINTNFLSLRAFPFQLLGAGALVIMFLMAATSHDFWLKNLSAAAWKRLHMLVYPAYTLLVGHVGLGALQNHRGATAPIAASLSVALVVGLHLATGSREVRKDRTPAPTVDEPWVDAGLAADIPTDRARTICTARGERIAVFKYNGAISAVTNVCAHQGGPLGEGKVIDGCITCPWHGWQYRPHDGCSPPPFNERITTYKVRVVKGLVQVDPRPLPPGTAVPPAPCEESVYG